MLAARRLLLIRSMYSIVSLLSLLRSKMSSRKLSLLFLFQDDDDRHLESVVAVVFIIRRCLRQLLFI
jgi:hypothetical protein